MALLWLTRIRDFADRSYLFTVAYCDDLME